MKETHKFIVTGQVQGVGFRYATRRQGTRLGLSGRVRNLADGSVEVVVQGEIDQIEELEQWLWRGPDYSNVSRVDSEVVEFVTLQGFHILT